LRGGTLPVPSTKFGIWGRNSFEKFVLRAWNRNDQEHTMLAPVS